MNKIWIITGTNKALLDNEFWIVAVYKDLESAYKHLKNVRQKNEISTKSIIADQVQINEYRINEYDPEHEVSSHNIYSIQYQYLHDDLSGWIKDRGEL